MSPLFEEGLSGETVVCCNAEPAAVGTVPIFSFERIWVEVTYTYLLHIGLLPGSSSSIGRASRNVNIDMGGSAL